MLVSCIIDGNYILSKLVFTLHKNNLLYGALRQSLENTILNYKKIYPFTDVFLVSDSKEKSWRKEIFDDYKASRKKDSDIDWKFVYSTYEDMKSGISGVKVLESAGIEGDDWISFLTKKINMDGKSTMIVSNDHDIKQLIQFDLDKMWINFMSNEMYHNQRIFIPKNYQMLLNKVSRKTDDIFDLNDNAEFINLFKLFEVKHDIVEIDHLESLFTKIVSGDSSDNIKSVYQVNKNGKVRGIGKKGAQSIYETYISEFGEISLEDPDLHENIADIICEKKKLSNSMIGPIVSKIRDNVKLIDLRLENLPKSIIKSMDDKYNSV